MVKPNKKKKTKKNISRDEVIEDERFDSSKPQFRKQKDKSSKVVLDERFSSVLTDPRFQLEVKDKHGRNKKKRSKELLTEFYTVEGEGDRGETDTKSNNQPEKSNESDDSSTSSSSSNSNEEVKVEKEDPSSRIAFLTAFSRGEVDLSSSSSDESESSSDDDSDDDNSYNNDDAVLGKAGILDPSSKFNEEDNIVLTEEESPYLAVMNMDWVHVHATDIFCIISSFAPPGAVKRVQVYPSDFGLERMEKEELFGPLDVWKNRKKKQKEKRDEDNVDSHDSDNESETSNDESETSNDVDDLSDKSENNEDDYSNKIENDQFGQIVSNNAATAESDFDPEKLRAYEASKLKYFFAVVEFTNPKYADIVYKELDGMEFEHSSAAIDLRSIPVDGLDDVIKNRELRDEATNIPSNYEPSEFVVSALQQSNVQCTWDMDDKSREAKLTKYGSGQTWGEMADKDDFKAYLASDHSSDEDSDVDNKKASRMRKMLGLDAGSEEEEDMNMQQNSFSEDDSDEEKSVEGGTMEVTFVPKDASKANESKSTSSEKTELSPWEKYLEKRKQKRREKRQAAKAKRNEVNKLRKGGNKQDDNDGEDDFFASGNVKPDDDSNVDAGFVSKQTKEELELLVAGEDEDEARDFDMRGLERIEKNKDKKLRGARKRKEEKLAANVTGMDFKVDTSDSRFKAVLDGSDERFGIDRTDPNFKETSGMREILAEQTKRRKKKRKLQGAKTSTAVPEDVNAHTDKPSTGAAALSALVQSIKSKVNQ